MQDAEIYSVMDMIEEGVIVVDAKQKIRFYNQSARLFFGLENTSIIHHPAGKIEPGDWVLLGDNCMGMDDGKLTGQDLELLGVKETFLLGEKVVVIGRYKSPETSPVFACSPANQKSKPLSVERTLDHGIRARVSVDEFRRRVDITVDDKDLGMDYYYSIGHLVVLDGKTGQLKFYQARGFTARNEETAALLRGKAFLGKGPGERYPEPEGHDLKEIHPEIRPIKALEHILSGRRDKVGPEEIPINGLWVSLTMRALKDKEGKTIGCVLISKDMTALKRTELQASASKFKYPAFEKVQGTSVALMSVLNLAQRAANSDSTVLLLGESGTGKSMIAKLIHDSSPRKDKPFVTVNLPAIHGELLVSELFGYEEGAFTGARKNGQKGKISLAEGGTLFLDEIGDMALDLQSKLLHFIQERTYYPVGSNVAVHSNIRIIAATNHNLEEAVAKGKFRLDLYYRLNVISLTLPPLRERREDIEEIIGDVLPQIAKTAGKSQVELSNQVVEIFKAYSWPGNVRELCNVLERAVNICEGNTITIQDLPTYLRGNRQLGNMNLRTVVAQAEREAILRAIEETSNHRGKAMKLLGMGRTAFYKKLKEHHLE